MIFILLNIEKSEVCELLKKIIIDAVSHINVTSACGRMFHVKQFIVCLWTMLNL